MGFRRPLLLQPPPPPPTVPRASPLEIHGPGARSSPRRRVWRAAPRDPLPRDSAGAGSESIPGAATSRQSLHGELRTQENSRSIPRGTPPSRRPRWCMPAPSFSRTGGSPGWSGPARVRIVRRCWTTSAGDLSPCATVCTITWNREVTPAFRPQTEGHPHGRECHPVLVRRKLRAGPGNRARWLDPGHPARTAPTAPASGEKFPIALASDGPPPGRVGTAVRRAGHPGRAPLTRWAASMRSQRWEHAEGTGRGDPGSVADGVPRSHGETTRRADLDAPASHRARWATRYHPES